MNAEVKAERWDEVARIFGVVMDEGEADRAAILARECAGDAELRREVEDLLEADAKSVRDVAAMVAGAVRELAGPPSVPGDAGARSLRELGLSVGASIDGRYEVVRVLGAGGMGVVVAARHPGLDEMVAIKLLSPDALVSERARRRFLREAKAAARLRSPHAVKVRDVGTLPTGAPYLVMDLLEGTDLAAVLRARGRLPYPEVCRIALQTCEALAAAHANGVIHRDIKPGNLFLERAPHDGLTVTLLDFGISKIGDGSDAEGVLTRSTDLVGSPAYMSPEQLRASGSADARSDIWSLGVVMHEMLAGARPFSADNLADVSMQILASEPPSLAGHAPAALNAVVHRCLEKDRTLRYGDVGELASALAAFCGAEGDPHARRVLATLGSPLPEGAVLEAPTAPTAQGIGAPAPGALRSRARVTAWIVIAVLAAGTGALFVSRWAPGPAGPTVESSSDDAGAAAPSAPRTLTRPSARASNMTPTPPREARPTAAPAASLQPGGSKRTPSATKEDSAARATPTRPPSEPSAPRSPRSAPSGVDPYATRR